MEKTKIENIAIVIITLLGSSLVFSLIWNALCIKFFGGITINFIEAIGILVLRNIIFKVRIYQDNSK